MSQNIVIPNKDNEVSIIFAGVDLTLATNIKVNFGTESYDKTANPTIVKVASATELKLNLSATTQKGRVFVTVTYVDGASVNGTDITSQAIGNLDQIIVAIGTQLVVETGAVVTNANTFATDAELNSYASLRGYKLPATQPERETLLIKAMDYLFSVENKMQGIRTKETQELPFPRRGVCVNGFYVKSDAIPADLKKAQMELAIQIHSGEVLQTGSTTSGVKREKLDTLEIEYQDGGSQMIVKTEKADAYLKRFYRAGGNVTLMRV